MEKIYILITLYIFAVLQLFVTRCGAQGQDNVKKDLLNHQRRLDQNVNTMPNDLGAEISDLMFKKDAKRYIQKAERLKKFVEQIQQIPSPVHFKPEPWCKPHNINGNAILTTAIGTTLADATIFLKTFRAYNSADDVVIAIDRESYNIPRMLDLLKEVRAIVYVVNFECTYSMSNFSLISKLEQLNHFSLCKYLDYYSSNSHIYNKEMIPSDAEPGLKMVGRYSINMMRYFFYFWWTRLYSDSSLLIFSDFRDVLFQSNPFTYKKNKIWPKTNFMMVFMEAFPNSLIYRCGFNSGWIRSCFGENVLKKIDHNLVSCSGVSIGSKNAMYSYAFLMIQLLNPKNRYGKSLLGTSDITTDYALYSKDSDVDEAEKQMFPGNKPCLSIGMDQGFHNFLIYSGILDKLMFVKQYPQGEGPVNSIGKFYGGEHALLKFNLTTWKILRGTPGEKLFYNWNGDISPVVHQVRYTIV